MNLVYIISIIFLIQFLIIFVFFKDKLKSIIPNVKLFVIFSFFGIVPILNIIMIIIVMVYVLIFYIDKSIDYISNKF